MHRVQDAAAEECRQPAASLAESAALAPRRQETGVRIDELPRRREADEHADLPPAKRPQKDTGRILTFSSTASSMACSDAADITKEAAHALPATTSASSSIPTRDSSADGLHSSASPKVRALCIGIDHYEQPGVVQLENCCRDASELHSKLSECPGVVSSLHLASDGKAMSKSELHTHLEEFGRTINQPGESGLALIYIASHGTQHEGSVYVVPSSFRVRRTLPGLLEECSSVNIILEMAEISSLAPLGRPWLLILDACRTPAALSLPALTLSAADLTNKAGYPTLGLVCFSAGRGIPASDGPLGGHSPLTSSLLAHMFKPGEPILSAVQKACRDLPADQQPMYSNFRFPKTLCLKLAPPPHSIEYGSARFRAGKADSVQPAVKNASGSEVEAGGSGLTFRLARHDQLEGWLKIDEATGRLHGTPPCVPSAAVRVDVLVTHSTDTKFVYHLVVDVNVMASNAAVDVRWMDRQDKEARQARLEQCINEILAREGVEFSAEDVAVTENCLQEFSAQHRFERLPFSKRIPKADNASDGWRSLLAKLGGTHAAACERLPELLQRHDAIGECVLVQRSSESPMFLLLNLSEAERGEFEKAARHRLQQEVVQLERKELQASREGGRALRRVRLAEISATRVRRTEKAYTYVLEAVKWAVLPVLRRWMEARLREFHGDVVGSAAADWNMSAYEFTNENLHEYRELMESELDCTMMRWHFMPSAGPERTELLAAFEADPWLRTANLMLNSECYAFTPISLWNEKSLCASCEAIARYLKRRGFEEQHRLICSADGSIRQVCNSLSHGDLLDREFHAKFDVMDAAMRALSGTDEDLKTLDKLRHKALAEAPAAKGTYDEVLQGVAELDEAFAITTREQNLLFEQLQHDPRVLVKAASGTGKTLLCVKLACAMRTINPSADCCQRCCLCTLG